MNKVLTITAACWMGLAASGAAFAEGNSALVAAGEEVFGDVCFACHGVSDQEADRIAPPVFAVKKHYAKLGGYDEFVAAVAAYAFNPTEEAALMRGAIDKFGLMPNVGITEEDARAVAEYLFATDFALPDWALAHMEEKHSGGEETH